MQYKDKKYVIIITAIVPRTDRHRQLARRPAVQSHLRIRRAQILCGSRLQPQYVSHGTHRRQLPRHTTRLLVPDVHRRSRNTLRSTRNNHELLHRPRPLQERTQPPPKQPLPLTPKGPIRLISPIRPTTTKTINKKNTENI